MTWFRVGGSGIPAALKSRMNAVLNKKFGTAIDYPPNGWPDDVNLMGPLPEATVSATIAVIEDGADDVPTKLVKVTIPASLSGVSAVSAVQTGRNLSSVSEYQNNPWLFWGTSFVDMKNVLNTLPVGTYTLSYTFEIAEAPDTGNISYGKPYIRALVNGSYVNLTSYSISDASGVSVGDKFTVSASFTIDAEKMGKIEYVYLYCDKKESHSGTGRGGYNLINAMLELGSTASAYEPYQTPTTYTASLGRTIYGGEVDIVNGTGTDENGNDFTFTGQEVPTRLGYNAFWSDEGDTEVIYRRDINLSLQAVSNNRGLMMARPGLEQTSIDQGSEESTENNVETEGEQDAR